MTCKPLPIFFFKSQPHLYGTSKDGPRRCLIQVNTANATHHPFFPLYVNGLNCGAGGRGRFLFERVLILSKFFRHIVLSLCADAVYSMNEQLKREVAQLEGEIRHQQYVHERTQDVNRNSYGNPVRWPPNSPRRDVWRGRFTRLLPRKKNVFKKKLFRNTMKSSANGIPSTATGKHQPGTSDKECVGKGGSVRYYWCKRKFLFKKCYNLKFWVVVFLVYIY